MRQKIAKGCKNVEFVNHTVAFEAGRKRIIVDALGLTTRAETAPRQPTSGNGWDRKYVYMPSTTDDGPTFSLSHSTRFRHALPKTCSNSGKTTCA